MSAEISLYEDPAGLSYDDLVAAWHEVDSRSAWFKARLAAAVPKGKLERYAADVGVSYATVRDYRQVANAYPAEKWGRPHFSFGVAKALMAQDDRFALVSREQPWTVAEARELVASRRQPRPIPQRSRPTPAAEEPRPAPPGPVPPAPAPPGVTDATIKPPAAPEPPAAEPDSVHFHQQCPGCAHLEAELTDRLAELEKAHARIRHLEEIRPDKLVMAERDALAEQKAALTARVAELEQSRPQIAPMAAEQPDRGAGAQDEPEAADSAHGEPEDPSDPDARRPCGSPDAGRVVILADGARQRIMLPDGELEWLCREHRQVLAGATGAEVIPAPEELLSFDVGMCQYPVRDEAEAMAS